MDFMKKLFTPLLILFVLFTSCSQKAEESDDLLIFSKTRGYRHKSIEPGKSAIMKMCQEKNINVDATEDSLSFTSENLKKYDVIVFLSTSGDILNETQQAAFEEYIQNGGGYVGIHAACDTEYEWPWYGKMVGGYFESHPKQQDAVVKVINKNHSSTSHLPDEWARWDEWYNFKELNPEVTVLAKLDESSYEGGKHGDNHPIAWYQEYDGGRAFYTGMGHTTESFEDPDFLQHVWGGIEYALGK